MISRVCLHYPRLSGGEKYSTLYPAAFIFRFLLFFVHDINASLTPIGASLIPSRFHSVLKR
jgi:hypothetical protein